MSSLSEIYLKVETLKTLADTLAKKGEKGISITISTNEETNEYGQNISAFVAQTKEERDAKKTRFYVGNGKVFWNDGNITNAAKKEETHNATPEGQVADEEDDLPF